MLRRIASPLFLAVVLGFILAQAANLAAQAEPPYPAWWTNDGLITTGSINDFAAANLGEAKNFFVVAIAELDTDLAQFGGAGPALDGTASLFIAHENNLVPGLNDYAVANIGELKNLTQPIYNRLMAIGYYAQPVGSGTTTTGTYPWLATGHGTTNDYATANIGQLKHLFSFDPDYSATSDAIPDWWKNLYSLSGITTTSTNYVPWSNGQVTYLQAYQYNYNPNNYYANIQGESLTVTGGAGQTGTAGGFVSFPVTVLVSDSNGNPLVSAPVTFSVPNDGSGLQLASPGTTSTSATTVTDTSGQAKIFYQLSTSATTGTVTAISGTATQSIPESTDTNSAHYYGSPFAPTQITAVIVDGGETLTWQNNDGSSPIYIYQETAPGVWSVLATLSPPTDSYTITGAAVDSPIEVGNDYSPGSSDPPTYADYNGNNPSIGDGNGSNGTAGPSGPGGSAFIPIPTQSYAVIDLSGSVATTDITAVALDDSNNAAFVFTTGTQSFGTDSDDNEIDQFTQFNIYKWTNGTLSSDTTYAGLALTASTGNDTYWWLRTSSPAITTSGTLYGTELDYYYNVSTQTNSLTEISAMFQTGVSGTVQDIQQPNSTLYKPGSFAPQCTVTDVSNNGTILGVAADMDLTGTDTDDSHSFVFILNVSGTCTVFDSATYPPGVTIPPQVKIDGSDDFARGRAVNDNGWAIGFDGSNSAVVYTGTGGLKQLDPMEDPIALNDEGQVVGVTGNTGYLWTSPQTSSSCTLVQTGSAQPISQLIPQQYQSEISSINPIDISGTDSNGTVRILFTALYPPAQVTGTVDSAAPWVTGTFVLALESGSNTSIGFVILTGTPGAPTISSFDGINSGGVIASTGSPTGGASQHALILFPVQLVDINTTGSTSPCNPYIDTDGSPGIELETDCKLTGTLQINSQISSHINLRLVQNINVDRQAKPLHPPPNELVQSTNGTFIFDGTGGIQSGSNGELKSEFTDGIKFAVAPIAEISSLQVDDNLRLYLQFNVDGGSWSTIGRCSWAFVGECTGTNGTWTGSVTATSSTDGAVSSETPVMAPQFTKTYPPVTNR
jgi:hypothetical protein